MSNILKIEANTYLQRSLCFLEKVSYAQPVNIPNITSSQAGTEFTPVAENTEMTDAFNNFMVSNNLSDSDSEEFIDDGIDVITENIGEEEAFGKEPGLTQDEVDDLLDREEEQDYDIYTVTTESGKT